MTQRAKTGEMKGTEGLSKESTAQKGMKLWQTSMTEGLYAGIYLCKFI